MSTRDLATKCRTYAHYVASREWFKENATLPFLLIVTPERDQEMRMVRVANEILTDKHKPVMRTTTMARFIEQGPLAPIWNQVLPRERIMDVMLRCWFYNRVQSCQ